MRGQKLFNELIKDNGTEEVQQKGRSNSLVHRRNACLAARYYYYAHFKHKCYEDILQQIMNEFFLSPATIVHIIQHESEQLLLLRKAAPTIYYFQNRWPHLKW